MTQFRTYHPIFAVFLLVCTCEQIFAEDFRKEIKRGDEREVKVRLESAIGRVNISKGDDRHILVMEMRTEQRWDVPFVVDYKVRGHVGSLVLNWNPEGKNSWSLREGDRWDIQLTDALPLSIDANVGVGKSDFDLTGLDVRDLKIATGASSSVISFGTPNKSIIENLRIESGVSKFVGEKLGNANFQRMTFDGGIGSYYLDFNGAITRDVEVHIKVGLGSMTVVLPPEIGAKVVYDDSWLSNFSIDRGFKQEGSNNYLSPNYHESKAKITVYVESGLGSVRIKRHN
ncbi:MAG: LiaF-related protein [Ignavibacteriales bacterium]|nr:LiaF-related protein [Ignavibacteriales bacterium]